MELARARLELGLDDFNLVGDSVKAKGLVCLCRKVPSRFAKMQRRELFAFDELPPPNPLIFEWFFIFCVLLVACGGANPI